MHKKLLPLALLLLVACSPLPFGQLGDRATPIVRRTAIPSPIPSATPAVGATAPVAAETSKPGRFVYPEAGVALSYEKTWGTSDGDAPQRLVFFSSPDSSVRGVVLRYKLDPGETAQTRARWLRDLETDGMTDLKQLADAAATVGDGRAAWRTDVSGGTKNGTLRVVALTAARRDIAVAIEYWGAPEDIARNLPDIDASFAGLTLATPLVAGVPREQALVYLGGESNDPTDYDPAVNGGDDLIYSGLVTLDPKLQVVPDLAERWEVSADGTVYTFFLHANARFHDGRPVRAADVIDSWERAADPKTNSQIVLTYMGDILGLRERRAGSASSIAGLRAIDATTLQVTLAAPRPTFLLKLTYPVSVVTDRANVSRGGEWYRTPNGTGPYRVLRWEPLKAIVYERNEAFYGPKPAIRYIVFRLYQGYGTQLYETGDIDLAGVSSYDVSRFRDPSEPLHADLRQTPSLCTSYAVLDTRQPPFDDPQVRRAFAAAVDRQRLIDVTLAGEAIPARGLYPPALPGYRVDAAGQRFDQTLARRLLAESRYGDAAKLPPITITLAGFGSDGSGTVDALQQMWRETFGIEFTVENLEPARYDDEIFAGRHGQIIMRGWCADYLDPENFAEPLFGTGEQENYSGYSSPAFDALLDRARSERDVTKRLGLYGTAEQLVADDAPVIFLSYGLSSVLVRPYVKGYVLTPIGIPLERYLSLDYPPDT